MKTITVIFFCFALARELHAYPNFISYGYQSCLSCHHNPYGGGPVNSYGRTVSNTIATASLFSEPEKRSGFFFADVPYVEPSLSYRGAYVKRHQGEGRYIPMDVSGALALTWNDFVVVGQVAHLPVEQRPSEEPIKQWRSREHYIGYRPIKQVGVYVGLMDKIYGIKVPDHILFSRTETGMTQNAQVHSMVFHLLGWIGEIGFQPYIGNVIEQAPEKRRAGFASQYSFNLLKDLSIGFSHNKNRDESMFAGHFRFEVSKGTSLMAEAGKVSRETGDVTYAMGQAHYLLTRGFFLIASGDGKMVEDGHTYRGSCGLQVFPTQRLEFRFDAYHTTETTPEYFSRHWDYLGQVHVWL